MNKILQNIQKLSGIKQGAFDSKHQELYMKGQMLLKMVELYIKSIEKEKMTDKQFFIDWEDALNELSVKDHNNEDSQS